ncbi:MAG: signal transduction histidine kinase [Pseudomonadales bacterium]|jgi:signal transduction histidine kinase
MKKTLKGRLVMVLLALMLLGWLFSASVTFFYSSKVLLEQIDNQLALFLGASKGIFRAISVHGEEEVEAYFISRMQQEGQALRITDVGVDDGPLAPAINIFIGEQQLVVGESTPIFQLPNEAKLKVFDRIGEPKEVWRVLYSHDEELDVWFAVGVNLNRAENSLRWIFASMLMPLLIVLPLTGLFIYYGTSHGIKPLRKLAEQISERTPESLAPIEADCPYSELEPLHSSLNSLLARLERALESEQRFTANAAHEMQTPLAAIKIEVQLCQRMVADDDMKAMLSRINDRVDRASHTVKQLLTLARLDPQLQLSSDVIDLNELLLEVSAELSHIAADKNLSIRLADTSVLISGNREGLSILVRNILGNAFKYTADNGQVTVRLAQTEAISLTIVNDCGEIADEDVAKLGDRFYRPAGSRSTGSGLGLSMVERICEMHGGSFSYAYKKDTKQFEVRITLPV